ncbi:MULTISPECIES: MerR family DNA-binding transcriptional regulator [unclassified Streptomyces]|uniref:MerR family DNA-binding transcriptional regulator n=1 Tax=unclassified Streptomyces TaxID=2593676 RepID=UPI0016606F98|nr:MULTISPECIES: MerR family DNA-binding transcriptional regulator [unclassified Streptomyces]
MGRNLHSGGRLRPIDLARGHGLSTQAIREYEESGILPATPRTPHGDGDGAPHPAALRAFLALLPGHGHRVTAEIMRAVNEDRVEEALRLVDESHALLLEDRRALAAVEHALRDLDEGTGTTPDALGATPGALGTVGAPGTVGLAGTVGAVGAPGTVGVAGTVGTPGVPGTPGTPSSPDLPGTPNLPGIPAATPSGVVFIGPLAAGLGIRPATLRKWERAGLVRPHRDPLTGYRVYDQTAVRDAHLVHRLRRGGQLLEQIAPLIESVRAAGGLDPLGAALRDRRRRLADRGRAMLTGAAELSAYLDERDRDGRDRDRGGDAVREEPATPGSPKGETRTPTVPSPRGPDHVAGAGRRPR